MLTPEEKRFILLVERGDTASVAKTIAAFKSKVTMVSLSYFLMFLFCFHMSICSLNCLI